MINVKITEENNEIMVCLHGFFDINSAHQVEEAWNSIIKEEPDVVIFNCTELKFIDSSAIGTLLSFALQAQAKNIEMKLLNLKHEIKELFIKNNFVHLFTFKDLLYHDSNLL